MSTIGRLNNWWNARVASETERNLRAQLDNLATENARLREENETLKVTNRIQEVELKQLTAVIARDLERVKRETAVLGFGGSVVKADLPGADVS